MKIVLIAGLQVGRSVYTKLKEMNFAIEGVFVLEDHFSEKVVGFVKYDDIVPTEILCKVKHINDHFENIVNMKPDLIIVAGWSQIISKEIVDIPPMGTIGFHYAKLPERRGGSPIVWALIDGLEETEVTMFYYVEKVDAGDIIGSYKIPVSMKDDPKSLLEKSEEAVVFLVKKYIPMLEKGTAPRIKQDDSMASFTKRRSAKDDIINWSKSSVEIYNFIRALKPPYPGAYTICGDGKKIYILDAKLED
ncbi:methionyl-tRNA formyltransferase [candidate division KSB1 bacterium]